MATRPAKRRRRADSKDLNDDEEKDDKGQLPLRTSKKINSRLNSNNDPESIVTLSPHRSIGPRSIIKKSSAKSSPKSSPEKARKQTQNNVKLEKSKTINTFFSKVTEEQRWQRKSQSKSPEVEIEDGEFGDAIEDDESSDDTPKPLAELVKSGSSQVPKESHLSSQKSHGPAFDQQAFTSSQRFVKPIIPAKRTSLGERNEQAHDVSEDYLPWADRYGPINLEELAVHKKKVTDVRLWLKDVLSGRNPQRLLVLKGPAGSGKSTTVSLVSQADNFELIYWQNPTVSAAGVSSISQQFDDFLNRGGQFGSLDFGKNTLATNIGKQESRHRVIVVEDFPSTMTRSSNALGSFRLVISQFLARSNLKSLTGYHSKSNSADLHPPMIMIISETMLSSSTSVTDSVTAHRLLGPEIMNHPRVSVMDFNPIAPTYINKALEIVIRKEARDSKRRRTPGPAVLQSLSEMGDVRSAVNSLEFLCVRDDGSGDWSGTVATKSRKSGKDNVPLTDMEKNSLRLISQRETTLDMFHAAGKIVYNKREDPKVQDSRAEPPPRPPDQVMHLYSSKVSQVDIEALLNETGTDIQTFISTIHENYVLSCNGDNFGDAFDGCADMLSVSDVLNPDSRKTQKSKIGGAAITQANIQSGSSDTLRQDEISFQVATRGLLFSLPYPVNRAAPSNGRKGDAYKMFYPTSLRLWKPTEEIEALISLLIRGHYHGKSNQSNSAGEGVASWKARNISNTFNSYPIDQTFEKNENENENPDETPTPISQPIRDDLTLEILPYLTMIRSARKEETSTLKKITQFHGMQVSNEESFEESDPNEDDQSKSSNLSFSDIVRTTPRVGLINNTKQLEITKDDNPTTQMEKLYISDDDIVDD